MTRFQHAQRIMESSAGKMVWKITVAVIGILILALLNQINMNMHAIQHIAQNAQNINYQQQQSIALLQTQAQALQRTSDATVTALQNMTIQITRNQDAISNLIKNPRNRGTP